MNKLKTNNQPYSIIETTSRKYKDVSETVLQHNLYSIKKFKQGLNVIVKNLNSFRYIGLSVIEALRN